MMRKNMPFGKEKMSQNDTDALIYRTESKLNIEGSKSGVKGGVFPAVASLAVMFALVIGGAYLSINSKNISSDTDPVKAVTPASDGEEESTLLSEITSSGIVSDADETTDSINIDDIDTSMLGEGLRYYYGDSAVVYLAVNNDRYAFEPVSSENEHLRVTIESLLCDDIKVNMTAKLEALDEVGEEILQKHMIIPLAYAYDSDGNYIDELGGLATFGSGSFDTDTCKYFILDIDKIHLGEVQEFHMKLYEIDSIHHAGEPEDDIVDAYTGIEFDIDTASNLATLTLAAESGDEIYMSPLGFYRRREKTDMFKDVDDEYDDRFIVERDARDFMVTYDNGTFMKYEGWSFGDYHYVINNIEKIDYNGQTYFPQ